MTQSRRTESNPASSGGAARTPPPGVKLVRTLEGHRSAVCSVAFDPTGNVLASGNRGGLVRLWDVNSGQLLKAFGHGGDVASIAFEPTGRTLACGSFDGTVKLWQAKSGNLWHTIKGHVRPVLSVAFDSSGRTLASASRDGTVKLWHAENGQLLRIFERDQAPVFAVAFDPFGHTLASGTTDGNVWLWSTKTGVPLRTQEAHQGTVYSVAFDPFGRILASGSTDGTVKLWESQSLKLLRTLEGHQDAVEVLTFYWDGRLLASKSRDDTIRIWRCDTWETVAIIPEQIYQVSFWNPALAFHPTLPLLATAGSEPDAHEDERGWQIHLWELDIDMLLRQGDSVPAAERAAHHTTAKVVLVGDSGVGKTGLGWRLAHGEYREHDSTHGQQFWVLSQLGTTRADGTQCEAVLWDLAGQPDYRLIHALSIQDADLALILFDPTNGRDPLGSAEYWLRQLPPACPKILVAARVDRGHAVLTKAELDEFCGRQGIAGGWLATSAASGVGLDELLERMKRAIPWDDKPAISTDALFKRIKDFVLALKENRTRTQIIFTAAELRNALESREGHSGTGTSTGAGSLTIVTREELTGEQVLTAVRHLSSEGFVRMLTLSTGEQRILLAPELLNNLAASMVLEARRNPRGLGAVEESRLFDNSYRFRELESLSESDQALLLDGTITAFLENRLSYRCFRESWGATSLLVFPDLMNLKKPDRDDLVTEDGPSYVLTGSTENTFAGLVVLLGYTNLFLRTDQAQDVAWFESDGNELCGVRQLRDDDERTLVVLFNRQVSPQVRAVFEGLVEQVLSRRDVNVRRLRPVSCPHCRTAVERAVMVRRLKAGKSTAHCEECGELVVLPPDEPLAVKPAERALITHESAVAETRTRFEEVIYELSRLARAERRHAPMCFVSYAWGDAGQERWVERRLAMDLEKAGITVVLDRWDNAHPGASIPRFLERIAMADRVLVVATPAYRRKFEDRAPETGTVVEAEIDLVSARLSGTVDQRGSVVSLLLEGDPQGSLPPPLNTRVDRDFRIDDCYFTVALDLLLDLYGIEPGHPAALHWKQMLPVWVTYPQGPLSPTATDWVQAGGGAELERHSLKSEPDADDDDAPTDEAMMRRALQRVGRRSLNAAFAVGQPVVVDQRGQLVWLHPDGTTKPYDGATGDQAGNG